MIVFRESLEVDIKDMLNACAVKAFTGMRKIMGVGEARAALHEDPAAGVCHALRDGCLRRAIARR